MVTFNEEKQNKKLDELRKKEEEDLAQMLSVKYGVNYVDLTRVSINTDALRLVSEEKAREAELAIYHQIAKKLFMGVRSPNKQEVHDVVRELEDKGYQIELSMVSTQSLSRAWDMYKDVSFAVETKSGVIDISGDEIDKLMDRIKTLDDVRAVIADVLKMKKSYRISRIVETVLAGAMFAKSSDVHIEPGEHEVRVRYRLDGVLTSIIQLDYETYHLILSRIKLISGLKLNIKNAPQDGRFTISINNVDTEVRTSILPDAYGESIVLRLLNPEMLSMPLEELGIEPRLFDMLMHEIHRPNGMLLNTGPTGSGKTTTLYAFLKEIHRPEIKIITIEDPVEYHLPGIVQTQVDKKNYTFASGLRAAMRQDPDIIMIGEIRDEDVASTAVHSALTGHFVFSTLHTNNAAGAIPRLVDLQVNPKIIGSALTVVMGQRLVRKLCTHCKKKVAVSGEYINIVKRVVDSIVLEENKPAQMGEMWISVGCGECNNSGFLGRIGIFEAIVVDEEIERLVAENPSDREIKRAAEKQGILSMRQDGVLKVLNGITSFQELARVVALDDATDQAELDNRSSRV